MESRKRIPISEIDPRQALYELELYHKDLELQNKELQQSRKENELLLKKYATLYNQSPSGYLTLDKTGKILELNPIAISTISDGQKDLLNRDFKEFISKESKPLFDEFFRNLFVKKHKVSCEAMLLLESEIPVCAYFEGISTDDNQNCFITMVDISMLKQTTEALKFSRREFQSYFENGSVGMSVSSPGKGWIELNQKFCQMVGYSKEELIGINWMNLSHPDDLSANLYFYQQALEGKIDRYQMDKRFIRKDGEVLYVTLAVACQRNEDGTIHHLLSSYIDITDHKLTEIALRKSEEKFRTLVEFAPDAFFQGDSKGNFIMVNDKAIEFTGYTKEELLEMNISDLFSGEVLDNKPLRYDLLTLNNPITTEREIIRKDGQRIYVEMNSRKMPDGTYQCLMKNITARKKAESALKESEERFKSFFEDSPDAIIIADLRSGIIIDANHAAEKLLSRKIAELTGIHHSILHSKEDQENIKISFEEWGKKPGTKGPNPPVERTLLRSDGKRIPVEIISKVITLKGKPVVFGTFRDITKRKQINSALHDSEKRYRLIAENSADVIWIMDVEKNQLKYISPSILRSSGYSAEEVMKHDIKDILINETFKMMEILPGRIEKFNKGMNEVYVDEIMQQSKDGSILWTEIVTRFMRDGETGSLEMLGVSRDISARKIQEKALVESEERFRVLFENSADAIFITDIETGIIIHCNQAACSLLGKSKNELVGIHQSYLHPPEQRITSKEIFMKEIKRLKKSADFSPHELIVLKANGKEIPVEVHASLINYNGKQVIQGIFRDITFRQHQKKSFI